MSSAKESLRSLIREGDSLKKEVDAFAVESQGVIEDMALSERKQRMQKLTQRSKDLIKKATKLDQRVSKHTKGKEPTTINRFDEVKADELKRLKNLKNRLEKLAESLVPDETEEDYFRKMNNKAPAVSKSKVVATAPSTKKTAQEHDGDQANDNETNNTGAGDEGQQPSDEQITSPTLMSKLSRLSLFRRSSKSSKATVTKAKSSGDASTAGTTTEHKGRQEQVQEKRESERQEEVKPRQKGKIKKAVNSGETQSLEGSAEDGSEQSEDEMDIEQGEDEDLTDGSENDQEEDETGDVKSHRVSARNPSSQKTRTKTGSSQSERTVSSGKQKKEGGGWRLFQRKTDRKITASGDATTKAKDIKAQDSTRIEDDGKKTPPGPKETLDEDDDGDEEDGDEYEDEYEDEEDNSAEDEDEDEEEEVSGEEYYEEEEDDEEDDEEDEGEEEEDEEEDEEEEESGGTEESDGSVFVSPDEGMERFEAVCDYVPEQKDDLGFKHGDIVTVINAGGDGWWMAEDEEGNRGMVPSTYLKLIKDHDDYRDLQSPEHEDKLLAQGARPKTGHELWKGLKKAINETSVTDVLTAMGAIPSGFRPSTTARLLKEDQFTLCNVLKPRLSGSHLAFKDIFWSPQNRQIRSRTVRVQKMFSIVMVKNIPKVGAGLETKSRHVRVAVFNGEKVLSNIHTVQATYVETDPRTWRFSPKMAGLLPSALDGDCFLRTNHTEQNIGLLFEMCMFYVRTKTGESGELSCGWVHLPLFDETTGTPVVNRIYNVAIKGGTPYEQDVEVDPSISRNASTSKLRAMMTANKTPRLIVKLITPTKEQKDDLNTLPDDVVSSACYIAGLSCYRKLLAEALLIERSEPRSTDLIHNPVLANFPQATLYPDIMDALRSCWSHKKRSMKKSDKRHADQVLKLFKDACMESIYPLLYSATLPPYKFGDPQNEQERWEEISSMLKQCQSNGILDYLLKPGVMHTPIDIKEMTFDLLEVYHDDS